MKTAHQRGGARPSGRSLSAESGLLEREVELEAVAAMIDLSSDKGQLLVIEGPPGIGKTSLLVEARALAREVGLEVLSARGSELELEFSHGVVRQLFEPCLGRLPEEEHAEVLAGAASPASPLAALRPGPAQGGASHGHFVADSTRPLLADRQCRSASTAPARDR